MYKGIKNDAKANVDEIDKEKIFIDGKYEKQKDNYRDYQCVR